MVFSINFTGLIFPDNVIFYIIGDPLLTIVHLPFSHPNVMFRNKQLSTSLVSTSNRHVTPNAIENGLKSVMGIMLLHDTSKQCLLSPLFLKTSQCKKSISGVVLGKTITYSEALLIKQHIVDLALYLKNHFAKVCSFFSNLADHLLPVTMYNVANEGDTSNHVDVSINRCPHSMDGHLNPLIFNNFLVGIRSPGEINDCTAQFFTLDDIYEEVVDITFALDDVSQLLLDQPACENSELKFIAPQALPMPSTKLIANIRDCYMRNSLQQLSSEEMCQCFDVNSPTIIDADVHDMQNSYSTSRMQ